MKEEKLTRVSNLNNFFAIVVVLEEMSWLMKFIHFMETTVLGHFEDKMIDNSWKSKQIKILEKLFHLEGLEISNWWKLRTDLFLSQEKLT